MYKKKIKRAAKREDERNNQPYSSDISWSIACDQPLIISAGGARFSAHGKIWDEPERFTESLALFISTRPRQTSRWLALLAYFPFYEKTLAPMHLLWRPARSLNGQNSEIASGKGLLRLTAMQH